MTPLAAGWRPSAVVGAVVAVVVVVVDVAGVTSASAVVMAEACGGSRRHSAGCLSHVPHRRSHSACRCSSP